jgi:hypothetical protein
LVVGGHADFGGPEDRRLFLPRPGRDRRVSRFQPLAYFLGIFVAGVAAGPLGREAPTLEIPAHGTDGQDAVELLANQVRDDATRPQRRDAVQLLRTVGAQQRLDAVALLSGEGTARPKGGVQCGRAVGRQGHL